MEKREKHFIFVLQTKKNEINMNVNVIKKFVCKCGAITLCFDNGAVNSMSRSYYNRLGKKYHTKDGEEISSWACDSCCNGFRVGKNQKIGEIQIIRNNIFGNEYSIKNMCNP